MTSPKRSPANSETRSPLLNRERESLGPEFRGPDPTAGVAFGPRSKLSRNGERWPAWGIVANPWGKGLKRQTPGGRTLGGRGVNWRGGRFRRIRTSSPSGTRTYDLLVNNPTLATFS